MQGRGAAGASRSGRFPHGCVAGGPSSPAGACDAGMDFPANSIFLPSRAALSIRRAARVAARRARCRAGIRTPGRTSRGGELPHRPTDRCDAPTRWRAQAAPLRGRNRARDLLPKREEVSCGLSRAEEPCHEREGIQINALRPFRGRAGPHPRTPSCSRYRYLSQVLLSRSAFRAHLRTTGGRESHCSPCR